MQNKLVCWNCFHLLETIPDKSINMIFTDPPYMVANYSNSNIKFNTRQDMNLEIADWDSGDLDVETLYQHFRRILAPNGNVVCFTSQVLLGRIRDISNELFQIVNSGVWHKTNPTPQVRKVSFLNSIEFIMMAWDKPHTLNFTTQKDMHNFWEGGICQGNERIKDENGKTLHPTQKPLWLLKDIISKLSNEGDIILDPFMGVGSIPFAAKQLNRQYIGFELDPIYFSAAEKRLNDF